MSQQIVKDHDLEALKVAGPTIYTTRGDVTRVQVTLRHRYRNQLHGFRAAAVSSHSAARGSAGG